MRTIVKNTSSQGGGALKQSAPIMFYIARQDYGGPLVGIAICVCSGRRTWAMRFATLLGEGSVPAGSRARAHRTARGPRGRPPPGLKLHI